MEVTIFLQENLSVLLGRVRNVRLITHVFKNVPIFERGGQSIKELIEIYHAAVLESKWLNHRLFNSIMNLLTKRGEARCGLSSQYIDLNYHGGVVRQTLQILSLLLNDELKEPCNNLLEHWKDLTIFVRYQFGKSHDQNESLCAPHCSLQALGKPCDHQHDQKCDEC